MIKAREHANEYDDGAYDTWMEYNKQRLKEEYVKEQEEEFESFCKSEYEMFKDDWNNLSCTNHNIHQVVLFLRKIFLVLNKKLLDLTKPLDFYLPDLYTFDVFSLP